MRNLRLPAPPAPWVQRGAANGGRQQPRPATSSLGFVSWLCPKRSGLSHRDKREKSARRGHPNEIQVEHLRAGHQVPSLQVVRVPRSQRGLILEGKPDEVNPPQDPGLSPELAGVPITEAALRGAGWVLRGCLRARECLGLGGRVSRRKRAGCRGIWGGTRLSAPGSSPAPQCALSTCPVPEGRGAC